MGCAFHWGFIAKAPKRIEARTLSPLASPSRQATLRAFSQPAGRTARVSFTSRFVLWTSRMSRRCGSAL
eukprot:3296747-Pyramimonas_sp.AAC.1